MKRIIQKLKFKKAEPSNKIKIMKSFSLEHNCVRIMSKQNIPQCIKELYKLIGSRSYNIDQRLIQLSKTCFIDQMKKFSAIKNDYKTRTSVRVPRYSTSIRMRDHNCLEFSYDLRPNQEVCNCILIGINSKIVHHGKEIFIIQFIKKDDEDMVSEKTAMVVHLHLN